MNTPVLIRRIYLWIQLFISIFLCRKWPYDFVTLKYLGVWIIAISVISLIVFSNSGKFAWIIGISSLVNICWANAICLSPWQNAIHWQVSLVGEPADFMMVRALILFYSSLIAGVSLTSLTRNVSLDQIELHPNLIIYIGGLILLVLILFFGFSHGGGSGYESQKNPIYEYAITVFVLVWLYSNPKIYFQKVILIFFASAYILQGVLFGDRSSAFPMLIVLFLLISRRNLKSYQIVIIGLFGIIFANIIDLVRNSLFQNMFHELLNRGFNVNTISFSHYAGVQIINSAGRVAHYSFGLEFIKSIFQGKAVELSEYAADLGFRNSGGGFTASNFYFWGGLFGVVILGLLTGLLISYFFGRSSMMAYVISLCIVGFSIRWYIYFPAALFRSAIIVPIVEILFCQLVDRLTRKDKFN